MMAVMGDFDVGQCAGRRRPDSIGEGDVVRVVHRRSGKQYAMKRIEVVPDLAKAEALIRDLTRGGELSPHEVWITLQPDLCFVHTYTDQHNCPRARCCVVEELAEQNMEQELVARAAGEQPFEKLLKHFAALLHGIQAYHAQGIFHRDVSARNIFLKEGEVKLGSLGLAGQPPAQAYYADGVCNVYSADIFALGLVFLEMALLQPISDFAADLEAVFREHRGSDADSQSIAFCEWLESKATLLGLKALSGDVAVLLSAMLAWPPCSRPTADDLLDWPAFADFADPLRILPVSQRPCVVMAHRIGASHLGVPRRSVMALPELHQIFSHEGAESAAQSSGYRWCGKQYKLWWFESDDLALPDATVLEELAARDAEDCDVDMEAPCPPTPLRAARALAARGAAGMLVESAPHHCVEGRMLAGEVLCRAALQQKANDAATWLALADVLFERGSFMTARQCFDRAQELGIQQNKEAWAGRLLGHCEFFAAIDTLKSHLEVDGAATNGRESALRAVNTALYLRFLLASEVASWDVLVGLGEFYRLVGCPEPSLRHPAPHAVTALSYFKQAWSIKPGSVFVRDRILRLDGPGALDLEVDEAGV